MKKSLFAFMFAVYFVSAAYGARAFIEGTDYFVDFKQNDDHMLAVLHVNFIDAQPSAEEAEPVLMSQMKIHAKIIEEYKAESKKAAAAEAKAKAKEKAKTKAAAAAKNALVKEDEEEEELYKNLIGSVWYQENGDPEKMVKVKFKEDVSAYVWLEKTKRIVSFPNYIAFLKKERDDKKEKDKAEALAAKRLALEQENPEEELPLQNQKN